jgi:hypothetical protein
LAAVDAGTTVAFADYQAICHTLDRYCLFLDENRCDDWVTLFAPNAVLDVMGKEFAGESGLRAFFGARRGGNGKHFNCIPNMSQTSADECAVDTPFFALAQQGTTIRVSGAGVYRDALCRVGERWLITARSIVPARMAS